MSRMMRSEHADGVGGTLFDLVSGVIGYMAMTLGACLDHGHGVSYTNSGKWKHTEGANECHIFHFTNLSPSQFMPLLPTRNLPKFLLRNSRIKPLQPSKNFRHALSIQDISIRLSN